VADAHCGTVELGAFSVLVKRVDHHRRQAMVGPGGRRTEGAGQNAASHRARIEFSGEQVRQRLACGGACSASDLGMSG